MTILRLAHTAVATLHRNGSRTLGRIIADREPTLITIGAAWLLSAWLKILYGAACFLFRMAANRT